MPAQTCLGCSATDSVYVDVLDATIIQNDTAICFGDSVELSVANDFCSTNNRSQFPGVNRIAGADVQIGNKGYYGTGYIQGPTGPIFYNDFWEYDNLADSWRQLPSYPGNVIHDPVIFNLNGNVFLGLGEPGNNELWMFEISTETWVQKSNFPLGSRYNSAYFSIGDNGYVVCGFSNPVIHNDVWKYNSISDNWTQLSNFPGGGLRAPYGASQNGYGLVFGGANGSSPSSEVWVFNPTTETWSQNQNNIIASRSGQTVTSDGNNIIVSMGYDYGNNNQFYTDVYSYNLTNDSWTSLCSDSLIPMYGPINFIFGERLFLAEGVITDQAWAFTDLSFERNMISSNISWTTGSTEASITVSPSQTTTYSVTCG